LPTPVLRMLVSPDLLPSSGFVAMFGPTAPWPARPWHFAQTPTKVSLPSASLSVFRCWMNAAYRAAGSTSTCASIWAWSSPQNSAHWPRKVPSFVASHVVSLGWPGIASSLPPSAGTHQLWLTSCETIRRRTGLLYGSRRWSTETAPFGYVNSQ